MILDLTKKLQIQLSGAVATNQCPVISSWVDQDDTTFTPNSLAINTNGVTAVDIVPAFATLQTRFIKSISVVNIDTAPITLTIFYDNSGTDFIVHKCTLQVGDMLAYTDQISWVTFNSSGGEKSSEIGKKLCQGAIGTGAGTLLFTATTKTEVNTIDVCNTTAGTLTLLLHLVPVGVAVGTTNQLAPTITIEANRMWQWTGSQILNSGDFIQGIGSGAGFTINASGREIT